ncbi:MAG: stage III sporulation protein AF [Bacillota bacterium]
MLKTVTELVRNITVLVLIAGFLEMLLPSSEMKRFIKVVMGLFILVSILNPLLSLLNKNATCEVLAWQDPMMKNQELNTILQKGKQLSQQMDEKATEIYAENTAKQIETVVKLVKGVSKVEADVQISKSDKDNDYGKISRVMLVIGTKQNSSSPALDSIKQVEVQIGPPKTQPEQDSEKAQLKYQVIETLQNFYNLNEEQIDVVVKD